MRSHQHFAPGFASGKLVGSLIAVILMSTVAAGIWFSTVISAPPKSLHWAPDNTAAFATFDVPAIMHSEQLRILRREISGLSGMLDELENQLHVALEDLDRISLCFPTTVDRPLMIIEADDDFDREKIIDHIFGMTPEAEMIDEFELFTDGRQAVCFIHDRLLLRGPAFAVRRVLERDGSPELGEGLRSAIAQTDFHEAAAIAIGFDSLTKMHMPQQAQAWANEVNYASVMIGSNGTIAKLGCADKQAAGDIKEIIEGILSAAKLATRPVDDDQARHDRHLKAMPKTIAATNVTVHGAVVSLKISVEVDDLADLVDDIEKLVQLDRLRMDLDAVQLPAQTDPPTRF